MTESTAMSRRSNRLAGLRRQATTMNNYYVNVAHSSLTYNMASTTLTIQSNSKWCHCRLMYTVSKKRHWCCTI